MGKLRRFLGFLAFVFVTAFSAAALADESYYCPTDRIYTSCASGYYLSDCGSTYDGHTISNPAAGNTCNTCPSGNYVCDGGAVCPRVGSIAVTINKNGGSGTFTLSTTATNNGATMTSNPSGTGNATLTCIPGQNVTFSSKPAKDHAYALFGTSANTTSGATSNFVCPSSATTLYLVWHCSNGYTDNGSIYGNLYANGSNTSCLAVSRQITCNSSTAATSGMPQTVETGDTTITKPSKTGYRFDGAILDCNAGGVITDLCDDGACTDDICISIDDTGTITGYDTDSWDFDDFINRWSSSAPSEWTDAVPFVCSWDPINSTVSFNVNGGSGGQSASVTATYDSAMPAINTTAPTRTGYTFMGWYDNATYTSGTQYYTAAGASARLWDKTANTTLYAGWKANTYTITLDNTTNGGTGGSSAVYTTYDTAVYRDSARTEAMTTNANPLTIPTKSKAVFLSYSDSGGNAIFTDSSGYITSQGLSSAKAVTNNTTKWYAKFGNCTCTNGTNATCAVTGVSNNICRYTYTCSAGYKNGDSTSGIFSGTAGVSNTAGPSCTTPDDGVQYKVYHYTKNLGAATYTLDGGTYETKTGTADSSVTLANVKKTITGFTYSEGFAGTSATGTTKPSSGAVTTTTILPDGTRVISLYYTRDSHTVTLTKGNNISAVSGGGTYEYGASVTLGATVASGYHWTKWTQTSGGADVSTTQAYSFTMGTSNVAYTANAAANTWTVTYAGNGNSSASNTVPSNHSCSYGGTCTASAQGDLLKTNNVFGGWTVTCKKSDGTTACTPSVSTVAAGGSLNNVTTENGATITLTAIWTACGCTNASSATGCAVSGVTNNMCNYTWSCKDKYWGSQSATGQGTSFTAQCNECPSSYNDGSDGTRTARTSCYKNVTRGCTENACSCPASSTCTCSSCTCTGTTYKQYSNADGTGNGTTSGTTSNETCSQTVNTFACNAGYYNNSGTCTAVGDGYYSPANDNTRYDCKVEAGSSYTKSDGTRASKNDCYIPNCSKTCSGNATSSCPDNSTCTYNNSYATTDGTQHFGGSCTSSASSCPVSGFSCNANWFKNSGGTACTACSTISFTDSGSDSCTGEIANAAAASKSFTRTCYRETSPEGSTSSSACIGSQNCGTKTYGTCTVSSCNDCSKGTGAKTCSVNISGNACVYSGTCNDGYNTPTASGTSIVCSANTFNVAYNAGGGSGSAPTTPTSCTYNGTCNAPANTYSKTGHFFAGWACTASSGSCAKATYSASESISKATTVNGATITLTATWSAQSDIVCAAGTYLPKGTVSCASCPAGKYCTGSGSTPFTYSATNDQGITGDCNANTYSTGGASAATCTACTTVTFACNGTDTTSNSTCPDGTNKTNATGTSQAYAQTCHRTTSSAGSVNADACSGSATHNTKSYSGQTCYVTGCNTGYHKDPATNSTSCPANTYTVTYKSGNTILGTQTCTYGTPISKLTNLNDLPQTAEYVDEQDVSSTNEWSFSGWATDRNTSTITYTDGQTNVSCTGDMTLYPVWSRDVQFKYFASADATTVTTSTRKQYLITTNSNYISATAISSYPLYASTAGGAWQPAGWTDDSGEYSANFPQTGATTISINHSYQTMPYLYAVYGRSVYLSYNANGGSGTTASTTCEDTQVYNVVGGVTYNPGCEIASNAFTAPTGYSFNKWAAGSTSGTQYAAGAWLDYPNTTWVSATTYPMYATWTPNTFTVKYANGGGTGTTPSQQTCTYAGTNCTAPSNPYTYEGSGFTGWACTSSSGSCASATYQPGASLNNATTVNGAVLTLTAQWQTNGITLHWAPEYGTAPADTSCVYGGKFTAPSAPSVNGRTFNAWQINVDGTIKTFNAGQIYDCIYSNMGTNVGSATFVGKYNAIVYTITYELNNGNNNDMNASTYTIDTPTVTLYTPSRTDSVFVAWYDNSSFAGSAITSIPSGSTGNRTVYAKWNCKEHYNDDDGDNVCTKDTFAVTYSCGDGTGNVPSAATATYDQAFTTSANTCTRTDWIFDGWLVSGTNDKKEENTSFTWSYTEPKTLTAQWIQTAGNCQIGEYFDSASNACGSCPGGYTSNRGAENINECYKTCQTSCINPGANTDKPANAQNCTYNPTEVDGVQMYGSATCATTTVCDYATVTCKSNYYSTGELNYYNSYGERNTSICSSCAVDTGNSYKYSKINNNYGINSCYTEIAIDCNPIKETLYPQHAISCPLVAGSVTARKYYDEHIEQLSDCAVHSCTCDTGYSFNPSTPSCDPNTYTITLNDTDGSGGSGTIYEKYATWYTLVENGTAAITKVTPPTRENWIFYGYYDAASGGTIVIDSEGNLPSTTKFTSNTTLYAHWVRGEYTCTASKATDNTTACAAGYYCPGGKVPAGEEDSETTGCQRKCPTDVAGGSWTSPASSDKITDCYTTRTGQDLADGTGGGDLVCNYAGTETDGSYSNCKSIAIKYCYAGYYRVATDSQSCSKVGTGYWSPAPTSTVQDNISMVRYPCSALPGYANATTSGETSGLPTACYNTCADLDVTDSSGKIGTRVANPRTQNFSGTISAYNYSNATVTTSGAYPACTYNAPICNAGYHASGTTCVPNIYTFTINKNGGSGGSSGPIYMKYNAGWYSNAAATTPITSITMPTQGSQNCTGYEATIGGTSQFVVNESGTIIATNTMVNSADYSTPIELKASWVAKETKTCSRGTYYDGASDTCKQCPSGKWCEGGTTFSGADSDHQDHFINTCPTATAGTSYTPAQQLSGGTLVNVAPSATSNAGAGYESDCYATVQYVATKGKGSQVCHYASGKYESDCEANTIRILTCDSGYYLATQNGTDCTKVGYQYYSAENVTSRTRCPGADTASAYISTDGETSEMVTSCIRTGVWEDTAHGGRTTRCHYNATDSDYTTNCDSYTMRICAAGYWDELGGEQTSSASVDCVPVGAGYYSPAQSAYPSEPAKPTEILGSSTKRYACPAGSFCMAGTPAPVACPVGSYSAAGASACTVCPAGKKTAGAGTAFNTNANTTCSVACPYADIVTEWYEPYWEHYGNDSGYVDNLCHYSCRAVTLRKANQVNYGGANYIGWATDKLLYTDEGELSLYSDSSCSTKATDADITPTSVTGYDFQYWQDTDNGYGENAIGCFPATGKEDAYCELNGMQYYTLEPYWTCATGYSMSGNNGICTANTSTVALNANGGTNGATTSVNATYDVAMPTIVSANMPTRTGYALAGLYDAQTGGTKYYNANGTSAHTWDKIGAQTLYAHWTANKYNVTYDCGSGEGTAPASVQATYDSNFTPASVGGCTKMGYAFNGWNSGSANHAAGTAFVWKYASAKTFTAQWTPNVYEITLDDGADATTNGAPSPLYMKYDTGWYTDAEATNALTALTALPTKTGYEFVSYSFGSDEIVDIEGNFMSNNFTAADTSITVVWKRGKTECAPGHYYSGSGSTCLLCTEGYFCPGGRFETDAGVAGKQNCPEGGLSPAGSSANTSCYMDNLDTYVATYGSGTQTCYYNAGTGAYSVSPTCKNKAITKCAAGYYYDAASTTATNPDCVPVGPNYYSPVDVIVRSPCPSTHPLSEGDTTPNIGYCYAECVNATNATAMSGRNYYNSANGVCAVSLCQPGYYLKDGACTTCPAGYYCDGTLGGIGDGSTLCSATNAKYPNSVAGSDDANDCYMVTTSKNYVAIAGAGEIACAAGNYCPGGTTVYVGGSVSGRATTGGITQCPANSYCVANVAAPTACGTTNANYPRSVAGSDEANDCYLVTTEHNYVATAGAGETSCVAGGYCPGGVTIYVGGTHGASHMTTGGRTECPANSYCVANVATPTACSTTDTNYPLSAAGSDDANDCYLVTSQKKYVAMLGHGEIACIAGYYCPGGTTVYVGGSVSGRATVGGITICPENSYCVANVAAPTVCSVTNANYPLSAEGSDDANDCYLVTTATKYVALTGAGETSCAAGGYCPGGAAIYIGGNVDGRSTIGGRTICPKDKYCEAAVSAPTACSTLGAGDAFTTWAFTESVGSTSKNDCYSVCEDRAVTYGHAYPINEGETDTVIDRVTCSSNGSTGPTLSPAWPQTQVNYPAKCVFRGVSNTCNPCKVNELANGTCVEKACKSDYEMKNGVCQSCNRENATVYEPTGNCIVAQCVNGFHPNGDACAEDVNECTASIPNATLATSTWNTSNKAFDICKVEECDDGYHIASNACVPNEQTCSVEHGVGTQTWNETTGKWNACEPTSCDAGYTNDDNEKKDKTKPCSECSNKYLDNGDQAVSSYVRGCEIASCMYQGEKYALSGGECVPICSPVPCPTSNLEALMSYEVPENAPRDETGWKCWDRSKNKCVQVCGKGYVPW